jgi:predicted HD superfamily hydrolase involved in NAD metabolism
MTAVETDVNLESYVRNKLSTDRWNHTEGVRATAKTLSDTYDISRPQLDRTALVHDLGRGVPPEEQHQLAKNYRKGLDSIERSVSKLWHAPAGAQLLLTTLDYNPDDPIVTAVANHTTGSPNPSPLLQALLVADFAEPNRSYSEAGQIRDQIGQVPLIGLTRQVLQLKIQYVMVDDQRIHPRSVKSYNSLCD